LANSIRKSLAKLFGVQEVQPVNSVASDEIRSWKVGSSQITVGRYTYGHSGLIIRQWTNSADFNIGQFCSIASGVTVLLGGNHRTDWITTYPFGHIATHDLGNTQITGHPATKGDVHIGNDVWIGMGATLLSGITIGDGAVIAAQALVTRDVAPYTIVGGNPAKHIANRFPDPIVALLKKLAWWDLPTETIVAIAARLSATPTEDDLRMLIADVRADQRPIV
jgi:acetyltransferase-like isoleucine patch superfamily enzyme